MDVLDVLTMRAMDGNRSSLDWLGLSVFAWIRQDIVYAAIVDL